MSRSSLLRIPAVADFANRRMLAQRCCIHEIGAQWQAKYPTSAAGQAALKSGLDLKLEVGLPKHERGWLLRQV